MRRPIALIAVLISIMVNGCAGDQPTPLPSVTSSPASTDHLGQPTPGATVDMTDEVVSTEPVPTWDDDARASAEDAAMATMVAFAQPDLDYQTWWAGLEPRLTQAAAEAYVHVQPSSVPAREVVGSPRAVTDHSAYVTVVDVETDIGVYALTMIREDAQAPWLCERLTPPPT